MARWVWNVMGWLAAAVGIVASRPRVSERAWLLEMLMPEYPALPTLLGLGVAAQGARKRAGWAVAGGIFGALLAIQPVLRWRSVVREMDAEFAWLTRGKPEPAGVNPAARWDWGKLLVAHKVRGLGVNITRDVAYAERLSRTLKLDIYAPDRPASAPRTAVIVLHPGGWSDGDKSGPFTPHDAALAAKGMVVFDAQYRFSDEIHWPGQLDDMRALIRWVKSQAAVYGIDPERVVLLGRSSGGHLALSAAMMATGEHADTAVAGVISFYGLSNLFITGQTVDHRIAALVGGQPDAMLDTYFEASPLHHVHADAPPVLLIHGERDRVVWPIHTEQMRWALRYKRVPVAVLRVPWGHHAFDGSPGGLGAQMTQHYVERFMAWCVS
jgi:acetyl esterase/lipase